MAKDKELIERLLAEAQLKVVGDVEQVMYVLARIDAERGKGAVAVVDECDECKFGEILPNVDVKRGDFLFLSPTIPEGYALVKIEPADKEPVTVYKHKDGCGCVFCVAGVQL